tara:strand:+ start:336 stop:842 length:507 start_codon:yes stop_codon:yes gene_type:complete
MNELESKYKKWLDQLRPHYNFAKSYIVTLEKSCEKNNKELEKITNDTEKNKIFFRMKIFNSVKAALKLLIIMCDDDNSFQRLSPKPFIKLEIVHKTLKGVYKRNNRIFPELTTEQKSLIYIEQIQYQKEEIKLTKPKPKPKPKIQKPPIQKRRSDRIKNKNITITLKL